MNRVIVAGLVVVVAAVLGLAACSNSPVSAPAGDQATAAVAVPAVPVAQQQSQVLVFSDGTWLVGGTDARVTKGGTVIPQGMYRTDGTGGPRGWCLYQVIRDGQIVEGSFWGTSVSVKEYTVHLHKGDVLKVEFGCKWYSTFPWTTPM